jgi:hypothetical protein
LNEILFVYREVFSGDIDARVQKSRRRKKANDGEEAVE